MLYKMDFLISSTSIRFNKSSNWELQLFLNDKSLGNMNVYVINENEANIYYLDFDPIKGCITSIGGWEQLLDSSRRKITDKYRN